MKKKSFFPLPHRKNEQKEQKSNGAKSAGKCKIAKSGKDAGILYTSIRTLPAAFAYSPNFLCTPYRLRLCSIVSFPFLHGPGHP